MASKGKIDASIKKTISKAELSEKPLQNESGSRRLGEILLKIPVKSKEEKIAKLSASQHLQLQEIEENAIAGFKGDLTLLESALGMLRMGHHFGWRVLYLLHSKRTIRNYEEILGIKIRDIFPDKGPSSYRSYGLNIADTFTNFWKVVGGDTKIKDRKKVSN